MIYKPYHGIASFNINQARPSVRATSIFSDVVEPTALRICDAAKRIGCSERELRRLINRGEGPPFIMIGQVMMVRRSTIDGWLAKREAQSLKVLKKNRALVRKFSGGPTRSKNRSQVKKENLP